MFPNQARLQMLCGEVLIEKAEKRIQILVTQLVHNAEVSRQLRSEDQLLSAIDLLLEHRLTLDTVPS